MFSRVFEHPRQPKNTASRYRLLAPCAPDGTIGFHMKSIYAKLHVHSKSEAVAKALRHRIVR